MPSARARPSAEEPLISIRDLAKTYGRGAAAVRALRGVSLTVERGDWVSIVGPSGSGKTTLLNIIGALDAHYEGSVRVCGAELRELGDRRLSRFRGETIGFIFQQFNLLPHLTVLENISVPGFFGPKRVRDPNRALDLLDRVGLSDKRDALPDQLSGGQQQRVAIARALFNRAELLLCDEPTGALDRVSGDHILGLFDSLSTEEGITLVVVTHEDYVSRMGHRIVGLEDGMVVADNAGDTDPEGLALALPPRWNWPEPPEAESQEST